MWYQWCPFISSRPNFVPRQVRTSFGVSMRPSASSSHQLETPDNCGGTLIGMQPSAPTRHADSSASEFLRGAASAATNIMITFPVQKLISRQAYEGLTFGQAALTLRADGIANLYRGVVPPLLQKGLSMGVMYGAYDWYFHQLHFIATGRHDFRAATDVPQAETTWAVRIGAALLAGSTEGLMTPFERMQTILQHRHYNEHYANTLDVARKLWPFGLREYYRGFSAILLRNGPSTALFFIFREPVKDLVPGGPQALSGLTSNHNSFAAAGGNRSGDVLDRRKEEAPLPPAASVGPGLASHTQQHQSLRPQGAEHLRNFASGAVLGAAISTLFYPINVAKSLMQLRVGGEHASVLATLRQVRAERGGVAGVFHGVAGNALRSMVSWGVINSSYELYKNLILPDTDHR